MPAMSRPPGMWTGLPSDRVMAVVASLGTGQVQIGSGYLVTERLVLTAWHCAIDRKTGRPATKLQVVCRSGGPEASATLLAAQSELDVAVLAVEDPPWVEPVVSEPPRFGRMDRSGSGEVHYCQAIGFPLWQVSPEDYQDAADGDPPLHFLVRLCVDWARCGLARPMPEPDLLALVRDALEEHRPDLDPADGDFRAALGQARTPRAGGGQVALLGTVRLADGSCGYWPCDYLVATDEGQQGSSRPIAENTWLSWLERATDEDGFAISFAAFAHENVPVAIVASHRAAEAGNVRAQYSLGVLLADQLEPPEMAAAVGWYTRAAEAGHAGAQNNLGVLLATLLEPPDLAGARTWYAKAAHAGLAEARDALEELGDG